MVDEIGPVTTDQRDLAEETRASALGQARAANLAKAGSELIRATNVVMVSADTLTNGSSLGPK